MKKRNKNQKIVLLIVRQIVFTIFFVCLLYNTASADIPSLKNVKIQLSLQEASRFDRSFSAIARQANLAFVIEGRPLKTGLSTQEVTELRKNTSSVALLEVLCKQYDYELVTDKNGRLPFEDVLVLRKKYSKPSDISGVTVGECRAALQDVQRIMTLNGSITNSARKEIVYSAFGALSTQQLQQLRTGVPISALSPVQKRGFYRIGTYFYLGTSFSALETCQSILADADTFTLISGTTRGKQEVLISGRDRFGQMTRPLCDFLPGRQGVSQQLVVEKIPIEQDEPDAVPTLGEALADVKPTTETVSYLTQKPLAVFNKQAASPSHLVNAVALVYGLTARPSSVAGWRISRNITRNPVEMNAIYTSVMDALPQPLFRAVIGSQSTTFVSHSSSPFGGRHSGQKRVDTVAAECVRRIEEIYRAKSKGKAGFRTTFKELGSEAQQCFAVFVMTAFLYSIEDKMNTPAPQYISDFEHCYAVGGEQGGILSIGLGRASASGRISPMINMSVPRR